MSEQPIHSVDAASPGSKMSRRLLVLDHSDSSWLTPAQLTTDLSARWDVLLLGLDEAWFRERFAAQLTALGDWHVIDSREESEGAHRQVRAFLIPYVCQLPRTPNPKGGELGDSLVWPEAYWWWFLEISEKSPMRGGLVNELYTLALLRAVLQENAYEEMWLALKSKPLLDLFQQQAGVLPRLVVATTTPTPTSALQRSGLMYWLQALRTVLRLAMFRVVAALQSWPKPDPGCGSLLFFSIYPMWWLEPFSTHATERFFPDLPSEHDNVPVWYAVWLSLPLRKLWAERAAIGAAMRRQRMIPLQSFVSFRAAAKLLSPRAYWKLARFQRDCRRYLKGRFAGFDVSSLVLREIRRSIASSELSMDRLLVDALQRLSATTAVRAMIFRVECQPLERALIYGMRGRAATVGFWHSAITLGRNYLPFQFAPGEFEESLVGIDKKALPLPDAMLATGAICQETLERQGYPNRRIAVCGPTRHRELIEYRKTRQPRADIRSRLRLPLESTVIFVATSVVRTDSEALLWSLVTMAPDLATYRIVIKIHPATPLDPNVIAEVLESLGPDRALLFPRCANMYDYIAASDALLLTGSVIAFEAMALGIMPIVLENPTAFSASSLADFADACFVVRSAAELRQALRDTLLQSDEAEVKRRQWPTLLQRVFHDLESDPNQSLFAALERLDVTAPASDRALPECGQLP